MVIFIEPHPQDLPQRAQVIREKTPRNIVSTLLPKGVLEVYNIDQGINQAVALEDVCWEEGGVYVVKLLRETLDDQVGDPI